MNGQHNWIVSPFPFPWDLLFRFNDRVGSGSWYRMTRAGEVTAMPFSADVHSLGFVNAM